MNIVIYLYLNERCDLQQCQMNSMLQTIKFTKTTCASHSFIHPPTLLQLLNSNLSLIRAQHAQQPCFHQSWNNLIVPPGQSWQPYPLTSFPLSQPRPSPCYSQWLREYPWLLLNRYIHSHSSQASQGMMP